MQFPGYLLISKGFAICIYNNYNFYCFFFRSPFSQLNRMLWSISYICYMDFMTTTQHKIIHICTYLYKMMYIGKCIKSYLKKFIYLFEFKIQNFSLMFNIENIAETFFYILYFVIGKYLTFIQHSILQVYIFLESNHFHLQSGFHSSIFFHSILKLLLF